MLSKITTSFALVITGTFSEFVACITVVFLFARVKWSIKLHFRLCSYLLRILSVYYRRLLFSAGVKIKCFFSLHTNPSIVLVISVLPE